MNNLLVRTLFVILVCIITLSVNAQDMSWRQYLKVAEKLYNQGEFGEAGEHYLKAWKQKQKKVDLAVKAGDCFLAIKNYKKAINAYRFVKDVETEDPMLKFKYARALKQDKQYDEANREFVYFISSYSGKDISKINEIVQNEIRGCEMGITASAKTQTSDVEYQHLNSNINSMGIEYAPIPFGEDILYYSSTMSGKSKIYRAQRANGEWSSPIIPKEIAAKISKVHFGNGSFSPDNKKFYFTQCDNEANGTQGRCEIFIMNFKDGKWTSPRVLPDYINQAGTTTTHPFVQYLDDKEVLFFVSDRTQGEGGLDIWMASKRIDSKALDFTFPKNLGKKINTPADEVSPFYDVNLKTLYFSSNGHISFGGFDIFKTRGKGDYWETPENMGKPFNSSADDWYFITTGDEYTGYFISNRLYGTEKIVTTDEDIFKFNKPRRQLLVSGQVYDKNINDRPLRSIKAKLYEIIFSGQKRLLHSKDFTNGKYEFNLMPNKDYRVEIIKNGYVNSTYEFNTEEDPTKIKYGEDVYLAKRIEETAIASNEPVFKPKKKKTTLPPAPTDTGIVSSKPIVSTTKPNPEKPIIPKRRTTTVSKPKRNIIRSTNLGTVPSNTTTASTNRTTVVTNNNANYNRVSSHSNTTIRTSTNHSNTTTTPSYTGNHNPTRRTLPVMDFKTGTYYTVQVQAMRTYKPDRYTAIEGLGNIVTEHIPEKDLLRIMIADFYSLSEARKIMYQARKRGFDRAYIAIYKDGSRVGIRKK